MMNPFFFRFFISFVFLLFINIENAEAQHSVKFQLKTEDSTLSLAGTSVLIEGIEKFAFADSSGLVKIENLPAGMRSFIFSHAGFTSKKISIQVPTEEIIIVELEPSEEHEEEVIV